jgi:hypothetical protein
MKVEISNGELLDKLSILAIKQRMITDTGKLRNIRQEYDLLKPLADNLLHLVQDEYDHLLAVNKLLWEIEDTIRELERQQDFGDRFIETARKVYRYNDERARIKREINRITGSGLTEEKSYSEY